MAESDLLAIATESLRARERAADVIARHARSRPFSAGTLSTLTLRVSGMRG